METTDKKCSKCGEVKSHDQFNKTSNFKLSFRSDCRACQKIYSDLHYIKNKERKMSNQRYYRERMKRLILGSSGA